MRTASHVHAAPCALGDADGHYKNDPTGPAAPPNEIWLAEGTFVANAAGVANERAVVGYTAGTGAVSVPRPLAAVDREQDRLRRSRVAVEGAEREGAGRLRARHLQLLGLA